MSALTQQIDADQHIEVAEPEAAHDFHALDGVDVQCMYADAGLWR
jgi:hypothetical protein